MALEKNMKALSLYAVEKHTVTAVLVTRALDSSKRRGKKEIRLRKYEQQQNHVFTLLPNLLAK